MNLPLQWPGVVLAALAALGLSACDREATNRAAAETGQKVDNAIDVRLPEEGADAAWAKLGELERKNRILSRDIEAVDLRLPDRLIVQTKSGRIPASTGGRDT